MTTYLYQKTNELLDELPANTGLTPSSIVWSITDQASVVFSAQLSPGDKDTLDSYMAGGMYQFVSET